MGKKYRELKKALKDNPCRDLILVDDTGIRRKAFKTLNQLLKKIESREASVERFQTEDQKLFENWANLEFREYRDKIEECKSDYHEIVDFHNEVICEMEMQDLHIEDAYLIIKKEHDIFANANEEFKSKILKNREKRKEYLKQKLNPYANEFDSNHFDDDDSDEYEDLGPKPTQQDLDFHDELKNLSDQQISSILNSRDGFDFLVSCTQVCLKTKSHELFEKVWRETSKPNKKIFSSFMKEGMGISVEDLINSMKMDRREDLSDDEGGDLDSFFDSNFYNSKEDHLAEKSNRDGEKLEKVKLYYRQLARKLHPDAISSALKDKAWVQKMWSEVQAAYQANNIDQLEYLLNFFAVRTSDYNYLSLSQIDSLNDHLLSQVEDIDRQIRKFKKLPAWGFSIKSDYKKIYSKIAQQYEREIEIIQEDTNKFRRQYTHLDEYLKNQDQFRSYQQSKKRNNKRRRNRKNSFDSQMDLFE